MQISHIDIRSTPIKISTTTTKGEFDMRQTRATLQVETGLGEWNIKTKRPEVIVDLSKTWDALTGGDHLRCMERIYNQKGQYVYEGIRRRIEQYRQIADVSVPNNPIGNIAYSNAFQRELQLNVFGEASHLNVSFTPEIENPDIEYIRKYAKTDITPGSVHISYQPGTIKTEVVQYPSVSINVKVDHT